MAARCLTLLGQLKNDSRGVTAMEYGAIALGIVFVVATAAVVLGSDITALYTSFGSKL